MLEFGPQLLAFARDRCVAAVQNSTFLHTLVESVSGLRAGQATCSSQRIMNVIQVPHSGVYLIALRTPRATDFVLAGRREHQSCWALPAAGCYPRNLCTTIPRQWQQVSLIASTEPTDSERRPEGGHLDRDSHGRQMLVSIEMQHCQPFRAR